MKRIIKSAESPFKSPDEKQDNYMKRKAQAALRSLDEFCTVSEDYLDESIYGKLDEARDVLNDLLNDL